MAERRMFAKTIIDSDAFLDMSLSTQALYFHLSMRADDDGFVNNPKKIQRMIGSGDDEMKMLIAKKFIIPFDSGVCVIKHWRIHNYIQKDRYKETVYKEEKSHLLLKDNKSYKYMDTPCIQDVSIPETQVRIGKDRIGKDSLDKNNNKSSLLLFEELGFGSISPIILEDIKLLEKEYTETWVIEALKEASEQGIRNIKYVKGILKNWKARGFKAEKPQNKQQTNYSKTSGFNNFEPREYDYDSLEKKLLGWED
ncbi:replication initiation protein [Clostridium paraputrificum]|uniref:DnaD domain-containing protein n=1 Tax=Clostridium paraputrificum TaxID=29363 RepID=UPI0006C56DB0|nr:DnaD domain protein [Clostridium paraputrificum]CUQ09569.1 replication initiation protein [Clostridium paraputrificum]